MKRKLYGELTTQQNDELASLLLELKSLNKDAKPKQRLDSSKIVPLAPEKNEILWEYLMHIAKLVVMSKKCYPTMRKIATCDDSVTLDDIIQDATLTIAVRLYESVWKSYHKTDKPDLLFSNGFWHWSDWKKPYFIRLNLIKMVDLKNDTCLEGPSVAMKTVSGQYDNEAD